MKPPRGMALCNACRKNLVEEDYKRCGTVLHRPMVYFDYECSKCGHIGRYTQELNEGVSPADALVHLSNILTITDTSKSRTKGSVSSQLKNIIGVNDLLKLGENDVPREPYDDGEDINNLP